MAGNEGAHSSSSQLASPPAFAGNSGGKVHPPFWTSPPRGNGSPGWLMGAARAGWDDVGKGRRWLAGGGRHDVKSLSALLHVNSRGTLPEAGINMRRDSEMCK